jgi:hypothetical protein
MEKTSVRDYSVVEQRQHLIHLVYGSKGFETSPAALQADIERAIINRIYVKIERRHAHHSHLNFVSR